MNFLFIPGINNTTSSFDAVRVSLPDTCAALALDCPAFKDVDAIAKGLLALAPDRFVVVGHSFGGYVALAMLAIAPHRLDGLVMVNSNDWADSETQAADREFKARQAEAGDYDQLARAAGTRAYHPDNADRADLMAQRDAAITGYGAIRYAAHQRASACRPDRGQMLKGSGKPVLVITGDHDVVIPTARQTELARRLEADHVIVEKSGHMLPVEQPEKLARALTGWANGQQF